MALGVFIVGGICGKRGGGHPPVTFSQLPNGKHSCHAQTLSMGSKLNPV
jgi:hypothetical protein